MLNNLTKWRYQKKDKETGKPKGGFGWFCTAEACKTFLDDEKGKPVPIKSAPCPACGKPMLRRKGEHSYWWGCSGFKDGCKTITSHSKLKILTVVAIGATLLSAMRSSQATRNLFV